MSGAIPFIGPVMSVAAATSANEIGKFNQDVGNRNALIAEQEAAAQAKFCLLYTSPSPRDGLLSRMPSSA